jgi:hypothetical protein
MSERALESPSGYETNRLLMLLGVITDEVACLRDELEPLSGTLGDLEVTYFLGALESIEQESLRLLAKLAIGLTGH